MDFHHGEAAGVPVLWADIPQPALTGMLLFRVGRADEPLARAGIGHLLQHLVLHRYGEDPDRSGFVELTHSAFHHTGDEAEVVGFFGRLFERVRAVPVDRLDLEKQVLRTEDANKDRGIDARLAGRRYGATTYGLVNYADLGLPAITPADVVAWKDYFLTAGNAVLLLSGSPPPGLRLDLPPGPRVAPPQPTTMLPRTPAWFPVQLNGLAVDMLIQRGPEAILVAAIMERRLRQVLRFERGISHSPWAAHRRYYGPYGRLVLAADGVPDNFAYLRDSLVEVLVDLATRPPMPAELDDVKQRYRAFISSPDGTWARLYRRGVDLLHGGWAVADAPDAMEQVLDLGPDAIPPIVSEALGSALAAVPNGVEMPAPWVRLPDATSTAPVVGHPHRWLGPRTQAAWLGPERPGAPENLHLLVSGPDGLTVDKLTAQTTIRYPECAAALRWPDGLRMLVANDGAIIRLEPNHWYQGSEVTADVDHNVPADRVIPMPPRDPAQVPKRRFYYYISQRGFVVLLVPSIVLFAIGVSLPLGAPRTWIGLTGMFGAMWGIIGVVFRTVEDRSRDKIRRDAAKGRFAGASRRGRSRGRTRAAAPEAALMKRN